MPYHRKKTKKINRPKRRKYTPRKKSYAVIRQPQVIGDSSIVSLRYCDAFALDAGIATKAYDTWNAASIFDPYVGVGGHQPLGADNWAQFYQHYVVIGAKATCYFTMWDVASGSDCVVVGKLGYNNTWVPTDVNTLIEQNKSSYKFMTARNGSRSTASLTLYYSPRKFFGLKDIEDEHGLRGITGDSGTSPAESAYFHFGCSAMNPADNPPQLNCRIVIEYRVKFTERKDLAAS